MESHFFEDSKSLSQHWLNYCVKLSDLSITYLIAKVDIKKLLDRVDKLLPNKPNECISQMDLHINLDNDTLSEEDIAQYYLIKGKAFGYIGDMKKASKAIEKAMAYQNISESMMAQVKMWQGYFYTYSYDIDTAKSYLKESIEVFKRLGDERRMAEAMAYSGIAYLKESSFTQALEILLECIDLSIEKGFSIVEGKASSYISVVHLWLKNTKEASKWLERSYILSKNLGYDKMVITNRINAANADILEKKPKESIPKLLEALEYINNSEQKWKSLLAITHNNLGNSYMDETVMDPIKALESHFLGLEIGEDINSKNSICHSIFGISNVLINQKKSTYPFSPLVKNEWFEEKLEKARHIVGNEKNLMLNQTVWNAHSNYYKLIGDYEKAYHYLEKLMSYKEKHFENEKLESVKTIQVHYDLQQKKLELKELELNQKKELEKINKSLEKQVAKRTKYLSIKNKELQEYAYIVAHDLKEPIRSIVSFTQLLERKIKPKLNDEEKELLKFIKNSGTDMGNLVNALLKYSTVNIDYNQLPENDMNEIINLVIQNINYSLVVSNAEINLNSLPKKVKCDKTKIVQLFQNLISNAIKFRKKDENLIIEIDHKPQDEYHLFSIKDNGIGIEKEYHDKIFKLFNRLNKNENYEGTGIGLSISKKIIEQHGGEIWIESDKGQGTTFFFTLPKN